MRIAINTRLLIKNKLDGIGRFSFEILKRLVAQNPFIEFHFIFDRSFSPEFIFAKNIKTHVLSPPTRHPVLWYFWFEIQLPKLIKKINPQLFFSPDGFTSTKIKDVPIVTVIHDINFEHRPKDLNWWHRIFYRHYFKKYATLSDHIITVSKFSKNDIAHQYKIPTKKITVAYNGVSEIFKPLETKEKEIIKQQFSNNKDYFIFIGSLHKRKNIKNLLLAFDVYRSQKGNKNLVIVGRKKWWDNDTEQVYINMTHKKNVIFLGHVNDLLMPKILASAHALCFTSFFEGFGMPIIEAMKSHVPVITSNTSSMPEIADNAAIIVDPFDVNDISKALQIIDINKQKREFLIEKGIERSNFFNWQKSADIIQEVIIKHAKKK